MVYDLFYVLLYLVRQQLVKNFCIYIHQRYWPVIFSIGDTFFWWWYLCLILVMSDGGCIACLGGVFPFSSVFWRSIRKNMWVHLRIP